ncbi:MAG TPA: TetR/AcrR family transcriptional regulator [Caulobacteraceae bacterium]|jgi:AcrR family transcriptional regulator
MTDGGQRSIGRRALYGRVWAKPMTAVAEELNISRNGLAKICDRLLIPYPGRGYWNKAAAAARPPLPQRPVGAPKTVLIADAPAKSRRVRVRLSAEARAAQLLDAAGRLVAREGLPAATMKRVAREAGVSEAQAHNYFGRREDLLISLARRELAGMDETRLAAAGLGQSGFTRVELSTITYLRQVQERGTLIQTLLASPQVRAGLRAERQTRRTSARAVMTDRLNDRYGVPRDLAYGATAILTAVCLRAGRLLAEKKIPLEMAERLSLAMVVAGNRAVVGRPSRGVRPS